MVNTALVVARKPEPLKRKGLANELREEAVRARSLASSFSDSAAVRDLLAYARALEA